MTYTLKREVPFWMNPLYQHYHTSLEASFMVDYTNVGKGPIWKDPTVEINCIPPQLKCGIWRYV
jgi:hypothetical protein